MALLPITHSDSQAKFLLSVLTTLCSTGLQGLVSKGGIFPSGDTIIIPLKFASGDTIIIPLNWKFRLLPDHFELLMHLNQ